MVGNNVPLLFCINAAIVLDLLTGLLLSELEFLGYFRRMSVRLLGLKYVLLRRACDGSLRSAVIPR